TDLPGRVPRVAARITASAAAAKRTPRGRATRQALDALLAQGQIDQPTHDSRQAQLRAILRVYSGLTGTRKAELGAVVDNADAIALAAFEQPAPTGVRVETPAGPFYAIYSFNPDERVVNAHLQALVGLYDFAQLTGDGRALSLFQQGDATAQALLPSYDTGRW